VSYLILKTLFRNLFKHNRFSMLNIIGLSIGFTFVSLIAVFAIREVSYDQFHNKIDSIYLLEVNVRNEDGTTQKGKHIAINQVEGIKAQIPGISNVTFLNYSYFDWDNGTWLKFNNKTHQLQRMAFTNAAFADIFSFHVLAGNLQQALSDPRSLTLTRDNARKIFGNQDPIGKIVLLNNQPVTVNAVIDDHSSQSSIRFDGLINYQAAQYFTGHVIDDYSNLAFFETNGQTKIQSIGEATKGLFLQDFPPERRELLRKRLNVKFVSLKDSYFNEGEAFDPMLHGNRILVSIILAIGLIILILAIINYINLSYAGSFKHHKELAVRSISGASRKSLVLQFLSEGVFISLIAFALSLLASGITIPWVNQMIDYPLMSAHLFRPGFLLLFILIVIAVGVGSGILPALSATRPGVVNLIKGNNPATNKYKIWRYLVFFQMVISIALISGTLVIARQIYFVRNTDMGFKIAHVITLPVHKLGDKKDLYLQFVDNNPRTESRALSSTYLNTFNQWGGKLNDGGHERDISYFVIQANADFLKTTGIQLTQGRDFEKGNTSDFNSCIINETAGEKYGLINPLSAKINGMSIVGVVKDFHIQSLHYEVGPIVILHSPQNKTGLATIRFAAANNVQTAEFVAFLKTTWEKLAPDKPFEYEFLDQRLRKLYEKDERLMNAFSSFSALAIIIACLGLFGLISFIAETKVKEIGVRKVNGAKISEVMVMLNRDFVKWVAIAFVIATPIAYIAMHKWLENFAYKTSLSWWIFALGGLLALGIALLTVSWQSWKAATRNPVEALRYE